MYGVYLLFILAVQTDGFTADDVQCDMRHYIFRQHEDVNDSNVAHYDSSVINYCPIEDIPTEINFVLNKNEGELTDVLIVDFEPPKMQCKYKVELLVELSVKNERECARYNFEGVKDIATKIHTKEESLCVFINYSNQFARDDNLTVSEGNVPIVYRYIFTGCYALRFHVGVQRYIIRGHKFLNTTYKRMEIVPPSFTCKYDIYSQLNQSHDLTNFTMKISLPRNTGSLFDISVITDKTSQDPCHWYGQKPIHTSIVNLEAKALDNHNCSINTVNTTVSLSAADYFKIQIKIYLHNMISYRE